MTTSQPQPQPHQKRIAIIGSGISGQTCGYLLSKQHHTTLFEANNCLGGHTATIDLAIEGKTLAVDTGSVSYTHLTLPTNLRV